MSVHTSTTTPSSPGTIRITGYVRQTDAQRLVADGLVERTSTPHMVSNDNPLLPMAERIRSAGI